MSERLGKHLQNNMPECNSVSLKWLVYFDIKMYLTHIYSATKSWKNNINIICLNIHKPYINPCRDLICLQSLRHVYCTSIISIIENLRKTYITQVICSTADKFILHYITLWKTSNMKDIYLVTMSFLNEQFLFYLLWCTKCLVNTIYTRV